MADISTPKEFLQEALQIVDTLNEDRTQLNSGTAAKTRLENELSALTRNIEQEKNKTLNSRRSDIEKEYNKKIKAVENEISGIESRKAKARQEAVKDRVTNQTAGLKGEKVNLETQLANFVKDNKMPGICKSGLYHRLFCPSRVGDWVSILIIVAIMIAALYGAFEYVLKASASKLIFGAVLLIDVAIVALYAWISGRTKGKFPNEIKYCRQLVDAIRNDEKGIKRVTKNIQKDKDDSPYNLSSFDGEITQKTQEKNDLESQKTSALYQFDNVTKLQLTSEIDSAYAQKLSEKTAETEAARAEVTRLTQKVSEAENVINANYVQFLGSKNLNHDAIERMISLVDEGEAASVTDAVTRLSAGSK